MIVKNRWIYLIGFMLTASFQFVQGYPEIISWREKPKIVFENKKHAIYKKNDIIKFPFAVITGESDSLDLNINVKENVSIFPKSKVQVLELSEESGHVSELYLLDGKLKAQTLLKSNEGSAITIKTVFSEIKLTNELEIMLTLDMKEPSLEVRVLKGTLPLEFFDFEKRNTLTAGQFVKFKGEKSDDRISIKYDFLLNGKKAPKGTLSDVENFDLELFFKSEQEILSQEIDKKKKSQQSAIESAKKKKLNDAKFLCHNPNGNRDQCVWQLYDGACFRKRCNAGGAWGDKTIRPLSANCQKKPVVANCDF